MRAVASFRCVFLGVLLLNGCSRSDAPSMAKAKGTLTYQGKPLADATLLFVPEKGPPAFAKSDASGNFQLTTKSPGDGGAVGTHKVTVSKVGPPKGMTAEQFEKLKTSAGAGTQVPQGTSIVPDKYTRTESTPLTATVEAGKANEISLKLD